MLTDASTADAAQVVQSEPDRPKAPKPDSRMKQMGGVSLLLAYVWLGLVGFTALFADFLPIKDYAKSDFTNVAVGPSSQYLLGTDEVGRDILARLIYGGRISLIVGVVSVMLGMLVGGLLGLIAGYMRGRIETLIMLLTDSMLAFPALVLLVCLAAVFGTNLPTLIIGLAILTVPTFIRLTRANSLVVANREFVHAARAYGSSPMRVIMRDIVPNVTMPILAYSFIVMGVVIVSEGSLSFLGLGVPGPTPTWGGMVAGGRQILETESHVVLVPGIVMFLTVLAFTVLGEKFRKRFDKREGAL